MRFYIFVIYAILSLMDIITDFIAIGHFDQHDEILFLTSLIIMIIWNIYVRVLYRSKKEFLIVLFHIDIF